MKNNLNNRVHEEIKFSRKYESFRLSKENIVEGRTTRQDIPKGVWVMFDHISSSILI